MKKEVSYRGLAWIAAMALFMQTLDATILNTALPAISRSLNESPLNMQLAIISYALTVALFIPLSGWLADRFGTRNVFRFSVTVFVLGSIACSFSNSLDMLVLSRVLQGVGGALMMPVARLSMLRSIEKSQLLAAWNLTAMAGLIGPVVGPILGGWLVTYTTWHWIFLINIPIGILGIIAAHFYMPNVKDEVPKLDWKGFVLFGGGLVALTLGMDLVAENSVPRIESLPVIAAGVVLLLLYYAYARVNDNALLPRSLFFVRTFRIGIVANLIIRLFSSSMPFLLPLMLQVAFLYDAETAGWMMTPIAISSVLGRPFISRILVAIGYKTTLIGFAISMGLAIFTMSHFTPETSMWMMALVLVWYGFSMSLVFTAVNTLTISDLAPHQTSGGSTMLSVSQQVGISFGIAVSSVILSLYRDAVGETGEQLQQAFSYTFLTTVIFVVILVVFLLRLKKTDGDSLRVRS